MRADNPDVERRAENLINPADYMTVSEVAKDAGVEYQTVKNWSGYPGYYLTIRSILGRAAIRRDEYEKFKREHPEMIRSLKVA